MSAIPVIAIFDVGKTNKKLFLFDEDYHVVFEKSARFIETVDEDGFPCENVKSLRRSVFDSLKEIFSLNKFQIKAVNFSAYGASLVYVNEDGKPVAPIYNYLKPYPEELEKEFYLKYGGEEQFSVQTASPALASLNSGLQLYRLKLEQPDVFNQVKFALHLPQYLSFLLTGKFYSEMTSIGCHTAMWNFEKKKYHEWIQKEELEIKLAPIVSTDLVSSVLFQGIKYKAGLGLHDSSSALIPYLMSFNEPFILISTGTWCVSMNPFNHSPLTVQQLKDDCLNYIQYLGKPVMASRLFLGYEHEQQVKRIAKYFNQDIIKYRNLIFDPEIIKHLQTLNIRLPDPGNWKILPFTKRDLSDFNNDEQAYHQLMLDLVDMQVYAVKLINNETPVKRIFVDGGFSKNNTYMDLLAMAFPATEVFAASMAQAAALGAALLIHKEWNSKAISKEIIELRKYDVL